MRIFPIIKKITTVIIGGGPNVVYDEPLEVDDAPTLGFALPESLALDDVAAFGWAMPETSRMDDGIAVATLQSDPIAMDDVQALGFLLPEALALDDVQAMGFLIPATVHVPDSYDITSVVEYTEPLAFDDVTALGFALPDSVALDDVSALGFALPDPLALDDVISMGSVQVDALLMDDGQALGFELPDLLALEEVPVLGFLLPEPLALDDVLSMESLQVDDFSLNESEILFPLSGWVVGRSGTPDTDPMSDGWADQASTGTNHGNGSLLAKGKSTVLNDERQAFLQIDLTRLGGGMTSIVGAFSELHFITSTSSAVLQTPLTIAYAVQASQWFTESTMTWATGRPTPTFTTLVNSPENIQVGAARSYLMEIGDTELDAMIGNWVVFRFTTPGAAAPETVTILSRDNATESNRPYLDAELMIV